MSNKEILKIINSYQNYFNDFTNVTSEDIDNIKKQL